MTHCRMCSTQLTGRQQTYCTDRCRAAGARADGRAVQAAKRPRTCIACGTTWLTHRVDARYCSTLCRDYYRYGPMSCSVQKPEPRRLVCPWCGTDFVTRQPNAVHCSERCQRRTHEMRRRARQAGVGGTYTWAEVTALFLRFDRRCAYCAETIEGQPDPDHVVPLSRGGSNSITNILPSCHACNCDKRDLLLDEWAADRTRRSLPTRITSWSQDDVRYRHLTSVIARPTVAA